MLVAGAPLLLAAALAVARVARLVVPERLAVPDDAPSGGFAVGKEAVGGFAWLARRRGPRAVIAVFGAWFLVAGALDVAFVAIATEGLDRSAATAGWLAAALGLGGLCGTPLSLAGVGRRRLSPALLAGALLAALPVAILAGFGDLTPSLVALFASGVGASVLASTSSTLLQRVTPADLLARTFGIVEGTATIAIAVGAIAVAALVPRIGLGATLVGLGAFVVAVAAASSRALVALDRDRRIPDAERVAVLRDHPIFALLPPYAIERLATTLEPVQVAPGELLLREGEPGDRLYLIAHGAAEVSQRGRHVRSCGPGDTVGEIALLRDVPRTATVRAGGTGLTAWALPRDAFLGAIGAHARSYSRAMRVAGERLARDRRG